MQIALIDDMDTDLQLIKEYLSRFAAEHGLYFAISCFHSGEDFLEGFEENTYSMVFIDIFMKGIQGDEVALQIRKRDARCMLIFLTNSDSYMSQAFSCHAFDYLQKPVTWERVEKVLTDAIAVLPTVSRYLEFRQNRQNVRLPFGDIVYVTSNKHNTDVTTLTGKIYSPYVGFSEFTKPLMEDERFLLINRGILVNMDYICGFEKNICQLINNISLPVRIRECLRIEQHWQNYMFRQIHEQLSKGDSTYENH